MHGMCAAEHVADDVGSVQPREHVFSVTNATMHKSHVLDGIEWRHEGVALQRADLAFHGKLPDALDQLLAGLAIGNQIGDRNLHEPMALGKDRDGWTSHHRAVIVHQLGKHANRRQA